MHEMLLFPRETLHSRHAGGLRSAHPRATDPRAAHPRAPRPWDSGGPGTRPLPVVLSAPSITLSVCKAKRCHGAGLCSCVPASARGPPPPGLRAEDSVDFTHFRRTSRAGLLHCPSVLLLFVLQIPQKILGKVGNFEVFISS